MNSNPVFSLYVPTKILFGCGEIKKLATETLPGRKAMIVIYRVGRRKQHRLCKSHRRHGMQ